MTYRPRGQLIYFLHPFLILIRPPSVGFIKRSQPTPPPPHPTPFPAPRRPVPFLLKAISSPVTTTPHPLSSPHPLYTSLFCARRSGTSSALMQHLSPELRPARGEVKRGDGRAGGGGGGAAGYRAAPQRFDLNRVADRVRFVPSPTPMTTAKCSLRQALTARLNVKPCRSAN